MKDFPEYSAEAKDVLELFILDSVWAIFYFEDDLHESVYERLLERLIPNLRKFAVICSGGKTKLIAKAKENESKNRASIIIADKDFDDILGCLVHGITGWYYLDKNCIENYFLDIDALKAICIEESYAELTNNRADRLLNDRDTFLTQLEQQYQQVTRLFLVARKYRVGIETTKMKIAKLLEGAEEEFPIPTNEWCLNYRKELQQECTKMENEWLKEDDQLDLQLQDAFTPVNGAEQITKNITDHLNGKHMFGCLVRYVQSRLGVDLESLETQNLYLRLLMHLELSPLYPLRDKIIADYPQIVK